MGCPHQRGLDLCHTGLLALVCFLSLIPAASAQLGRPEGLYYKSWAVVIGINDYLVAPKLDGAVEDGKAVADAFRKLGFQEVLEVYNKDASSKRMHFILNEHLPRKVGRHDRVVIFFAGHAGASQDMHNKDIGYLVPWDAQPANVSKAVTMDHLKEFSRRVMAKHVLFVLDAAVSGLGRHAAPGTVAGRPPLAGRRHGQTGRASLECRPPGRGTDQEGRAGDVRHGIPPWIARRCGREPERLDHGQ